VFDDASDAASETSLGGRKGRARPRASGDPIEQFVGDEEEED